MTSLHDVVSIGVDKRRSTIVASSAQIIIIYVNMLCISEEEARLLTGSLPVILFFSMCKEQNQSKEKA